MIKEILLLLLIISPISAQFINEILPDPQGSDTAPMPNGEWIELSNTTNDLTGWYFTDDTPTHRLTIAATNTLITDSYTVVYRNGDSDFSLNNGEDELHLYTPNGTLSTSTSYHRTSMGLSWAYLGGTIPWNLTIPTPGKENVNLSATCDVLVQITPPNDFSRGDEIVTTAKTTYGNGSTFILQRRISNGNNDTLALYKPKELSITFSHTERYHPRLHGGQFFRAETWIENATCNDDLTNDYASTLFWADPLEQEQTRFSIPTHIIKGTLKDEKIPVTWDLPIASLIQGDHTLQIGNETLLSIEADPDPTLIHLRAQFSPPQCANGSITLSAKGPKFSDDYELTLKPCMQFTKDVTQAAALVFTSENHDLSVGENVSVNITNMYEHPVSFIVKTSIKQERHNQDISQQTIHLSPHNTKQLTYTIPTTNLSGLTSFIVESNWQGRKTPKTLTIPIVIAPQLTPTTKQITELPRITYVSREQRFTNWIPLILLLLVLLWLPLLPKAI